METEKLKDTLKQLHTSLESGERPDPELRRLLQDLACDIQKALDKAPPAGEGEASLEDRARSVSARFAAEHPYLESTLRDLMDGLGKMGI